MGTCGRHPVSLQHCSVPVAVGQEPDDTKKNLHSCNTGKFCNIFLRAAIPGIKGLLRYLAQREMGFELS